MERNKAIEVIKKNYPHVAESGSQFETALRILIPELEESEDERIRKSIMELLSEVHFTSKYYDINKMLAWLKKQGEQKPDDKVELKFHGGDWVVLSTLEGEKVVQVDFIEYLKSGDPSYITSEGMWFDNRTKAHFWTIANAKDGDVLFIGIDGSTCIFKKLEGNLLYSYIISDGKLLVENSHYYYETSDGIHPATKEQRDLLFQKMKEAGYEWDAEKKELKKIEPKTTTWTPIDEQRVENLLAIIEGHGYPEEVAWLNSLKDRVQSKQGEQNKHVWSKEDEEMYKKVEAAIDSYYAPFSRDVEEMSEWFKNLKDRVQPQPKQEWSEKDERERKHCIDFLNHPNMIKVTPTVKKGCIDWLKSLKPQNKWKPSDEEMKALADALSLANNCGEENAFDLRTLYEQLKKLREE